jgi:hypothetical protein
MSYRDGHHRHWNKLPLRLLQPGLLTTMYRVLTASAPWDVCFEPIPAGSNSPLLADSVEKVDV